MYGRGTQATSVFVIWQTFWQASFQYHETELGRTQEKR